MSMLRKYVLNVSGISGQGVDIRTSSSPFFRPNANFSSVDLKRTEATDRPTELHLFNSTEELN